MHEVRKMARRLSEPKNQFADFGILAFYHSFGSSFETIFIYLSIYLIIYVKISFYLRFKECFRVYLAQSLS